MIDCKRLLQQITK